MSKPGTVQVKSLKPTFEDMTQLDEEKLVSARRGFYENAFVKEYEPLNIYSFHITIIICHYNNLFSILAKVWLILASQLAKLVYLSWSWHFR